MYKLIVSIIRHERLEAVIAELKKEGINFTFSEVKGFCKEVHLYHKDIQNRVRVEVISDEKDVSKIRDIIVSNACCGLGADGCLAVLSLDDFLNFS